MKKLSTKLLCIDVIIGIITIICCLAFEFNSSIDKLISIYTHLSMIVIPINIYDILKELIISN